MMVITCPHCQHQERVKTAYEHIKYRCDGCNRRFKLINQGDNLVAVPAGTEQELKIV
jgi:transposase-like protein